MLRGVRPRTFAKKNRIRFWKSYTTPPPFLSYIPPKERGSRTRIDGLYGNHNCHHKCLRGVSLIPLGIGILRLSGTRGIRLRQRTREAALSAIAAMWSSQMKGSKSGLRTTYRRASHWVCCGTYCPKNGLHPPTRPHSYLSGHEVLLLFGTLCFALV